MFRVFALLAAWVGLAVAQTVSHQYIVELSGEAPRAKATESSSAARGRVVAAQAPVRARLATMGVTTRDSLSTVLNALIVDIPAGLESQVQFLPGVARITEVTLARAGMDSAPLLVQAPAAWANLSLGEDGAGLGIKIGIIDTGIDQTHPGFQDASLPMPPGFPKAESEASLAFTTNKIIVARTYASLYTDAPETADKSPRDVLGHGSSVAMAAAGVKHVAPAGTVSGIAPKAYLGNYNAALPASVGTGLFSSAAVLKAFDDAVADGMDVINLSLGNSLAPRLAANMPWVEAVRNAESRGVVVVAIAGNDGPLPSSIDNYGQPPEVLAVGASGNSRVLSASVRMENGPAFPARTGSGTNDETPPVSGLIVDVSTIEATGLACNPLPPGSLSGKIVLVARGNCVFEIKANYAAAAGARAMVLYTTAASPDAYNPFLGDATLPTVMLSNADGLRLKQLLGEAGANGTFDPRLTLPLPRDAKPLAPFSGVGPSTDYFIKPDITAPGVAIYTAVPASQRAAYGGSYATFSGTSLSSPIVAGGVAFLKGARPGFTAAQYRSMVINTGTWMDERLQQRGNGRMNLEAAMQTPVTAVPPSVSYLTSGSTVNESRDFTLTNIGRTAQTFQIAVVPLSAGPAPVLTSESEVTLDAGQSTTVRTLLAASDLPAGERNGLFVVKASGGAQILVPYWHGVPDNVPAVISFPSKPTSVAPGATTTVFMRLLDAAGMVAVGPVPQITVETPGAAAVQLFTGGTSRPGFWAVSVRAQPTEGILTVLVRAGNAEGRVQIPVF